MTASRTRATGPSPAPVSLLRRTAHRAGPYLLTGALSFVVMAVMTELWRADWSAPFQWFEDAVSSAGHFKTTLETGWYEYQPRLGWPYGQHYHDFPFSDDLNQVVIRFFGILSGDWVWVFNTYYVAAFPAIGMTALFFLRRCAVATPLAVVLAVLYAVAPYHFFRGERHFFLGQYWMVPLALWVVLGIAQGRRIWAGRVLPENWSPPVRRVLGAVSGRGAGTAAILVLTTMSGAYYGVFAAVLAACVGLLSFVRRRSWARLGAAVMAAGVVGLTLWLAFWPDRAFRAVYGTNLEAAVRDTEGAEMYALTLSQMLMPTPGHRIPVLAELREAFDETMPYGAEKSSLGLVAAIGLICAFCVLGGLLLGRLKPVTGDPARDGRRVMLGQLSAITITAILISTVGGVGSLIALLSSNAIRGWNRMSIFIMLLALAILGLGIRAGLERLARRVRGPQPLQLWTTAVASIVLMTGMVDQASEGVVPDYEGVAATFRAEADFVASIEQQLPPGSAVFQYPPLEWPEGPVSNYMHSNDQLRPFLHSTTLNWSGGGFKGRPQIDWQLTVAAQPLPDLVRDLAIIGFSGLTVDNWALDDFGRQTGEDLTGLLGPATAASADGRFVYFPLAVPIEQVHSEFSPHELEAEADRLTNGAFSTAPR